MNENSEKVENPKEMDDTAVNSKPEVNSVITNTNSVNLSLLSKRARKRLERKMKWESNKPQKRRKERLKKKQKIVEYKKKNIKLGPTRKELKQSTMANSNCKINVAIDMSFDHLMSDKDLGKVIKQILRVYSLNRRCLQPLQFYVASFGGKAEAEMSKHLGYLNWDVHFRKESYLDIFPKENIVYLTSESENIITNLEDHKAYIIGGLVDHNSQKGLCYKIAKEQNISHGRLPIDEFIVMKTRKVLTIDQVFEIILRVTEGNSWKEAFLKVLPSRKGAIDKEELVEHKIKKEKLENLDIQVENEKQKEEENLDYKNDPS